jgi:NADH-quinone oxidoreductase subunit J
MVLAHRERFEHRKSQRELSEERFRGVGRPTPLPGPGVYARRNAVDSAALLPDGSYSELSVSSILQSRDGDGVPIPPREALPEPVKGGAS